MGLTFYMSSLLSDVSEFFSFCLGVFDALPFAIQTLICFVFGSVLLFGLMRMVIRMDG